MRRVVAVLLAVLLATPTADMAAPSLGVIQGVVTVDGRPLTGVSLTLIDVNTGSMHRTVSAAQGAFKLQLAPGQYVVAPETRAGLVVGRGPSVVPVAAGQIASTRIDLLALPSAVVQQAPAKEQPAQEQAPKEPAPANTTVITHDPPVTCLIAGEFPLFDALIEPAASVARARVYFKAAKGTEWFYVEMQPQGGRFVGKLPRPRVEASPVSYYIQATTTEFGDAQTPEYAPIVVEKKEDCGDNAVIAPFGPPGAVTVFSAATGAAIAPAGFAAGGIALTLGTIALITGGAIAAGVAAAVTLSNPSPSPIASPSPEPTPTPTPTPTPRPTPEPSPSPKPPPQPTPPPPVTP